MSTFDPAVFENTVVEGEMETRYTPLSEGDYTGFIDDIKFREAGDGYLLEIHWKITDDEAKKQLGRDEVIVRQGIFLDGHVDEKSNKFVFEFGANKNVRLGKLREAVGQNKPGPWSPGTLRGAGPCLLRVTQRADKNDPETIYNDVAKVTKAK